jgi:hypothetical protein
MGEKRPNPVGPREMSSVDFRVSNEGQLAIDGKPQLHSGLRSARGWTEAVGETSERPPPGLLSTKVWRVRCAEIHGERQEENEGEGYRLKDGGQEEEQWDEQCRER